MNTAAVSVRTVRIRTGGPRQFPLERDSVTNDQTPRIQKIPTREAVTKSRCNNAYPKYTSPMHRTRAPTRTREVFTGAVKHLPSQSNVSQTSDCGRVVQPTCDTSRVIAPTYRWPKPAQVIVGVFVALSVFSAVVYAAVLVGILIGGPSWFLAVYPIGWAAGFFAARAVHRWVFSPTNRLVQGSQQ
jgi:hypothetical protein